MISASAYGYFFFTILANKTHNLLIVHMSLSIRGEIHLKREAKLQLKKMNLEIWCLWLLVKECFFLKRNALLKLIRKIKICCFGSLFGLIYIIILLLI